MFTAAAAAAAAAAAGPLAYAFLPKASCECAAASRLTMLLRAASRETASPRRQRASCAKQRGKIGRWSEGACIRRLCMLLGAAEA